MLGEGCGCVDGQGEDHVDREVTPGAAGFHERQGTAMRWAGFEELLPAVLGERHEEKRGGIPVPAGVERRAIPPCSRKKRATRMGHPELCLVRGERRTSCDSRVSRVMAIRQAQARLRTSRRCGSARSSAVLDFSHA
jgi:hypothetical protein